MPVCRIAKRGYEIEQLNIVGKRSGSGFVAHKATLVSALSRASAERVMLMDFTIGRRGLLGYLKALAGSNIVKIVPSANGSASETQAAEKRLKVTCGANTSYLEDSAWVGEKTPMTICDVRVSPKVAVKPNIGALELSEALSRVVPFTAREDTRPVLQCVRFVAKDGKLTMVSADGFRLAIVTLDCDTEGEVLISRDDLTGIANALRKARRANIGFEKKPESLEGCYLILDTELIRYRWIGVEGTYPECEKLIPADFNTTAHFDSVEAVKAVNSLKVLADSKSYPIDLTIGSGKLTMSNPDEKGMAEIPADTQGEGRVRIDGRYLADALRACGGMVDLSLVDEWSPMVFSVDGYQLVTMPMPARPRPQAEAQPTETVTETPVVEAETCGEPDESKAEAVAEGEELTSPKPRRKHKAREAVAV